MQQSWPAQQVRTLAAAFTFLTRLPVGRIVAHSLDDLPRSAAYFPIVGLCIGAIGSLIFAAALLLWSPPIAVILSIIATVLATGAFHEDALADSLDGFAGGWTKEQVLAIMKDSRVGSYALTGMILALGLKVGALLAIDQPNGALSEAATARSDAFFHALPVVRALMAAHVLSRWSSVWLIRTHAYVRQEDANARASAGRPFVSGASNATLLTATLWSVGIVVVLLGVNAAPALLVALGVSILSGRYFRRRIGGITGDALGAANQMVEVCVYLTLAAAPLAAFSL